jgi:hypothetical protein
VKLRFGDLIAFGCCCLFVFFAGREVYRGLTEVLSFATTQGTVRNFVAPDRNAADNDLARGRIQYEYSVRGNRYEGSYPDFSFSATRAPFAVFGHSWKAGDPIAVYYSPDEPAVSTLDPRVEPMAFVFLTFVLPFFVLCSATILGKASSMQEDKSDSAKLTGSSVLWVSYFVLSAIASAALAVVANFTNWQTASIVGLLTPTVLVPCCVKGIGYWTRRSAFRANPRLAVLDRIRRRYIVFFVLASLFWWSLVGVFIFQMLDVAIESLYAQYRYMTVSGKVIENRVKVLPPSGKHHHSSYRPIIAYEYLVQGRQYRGDRIFCGLGRASWSRETAEYIQRQYPVGSRVTVHYNPRDPQAAALSSAFMSYQAFSFFCLVPFVVIGVFLVVQIIRLARAAPESRLWDMTQSSPFARVACTWFVSHLVSIFALALAGACYPERSWTVWIGVGIVAAATTISAWLSYRPVARGKSKEEVD